MTSELLPCPNPFGCESEPRLVADGAIGSPVVWCIACGLHGPSCETPAEAITAWNTRASLTEQPPTCDDEGCPHFNAPHGHPTEQPPSDGLAVRNAINDALAGWRYIRLHHGDLYGVGWDRVEAGLSKALTALSCTDAATVERVARAIHVARFDTAGARPIEPMGPADHEYCNRLATAALAALRDPGAGA